jgi:hypothetical protein
MDFLGLFAWILVIIGFLLLPFLVGLPILMVGWLLLLFDQFRSWYTTIFPPAIRTQIAATLKKDYQPYQPAIKSLKSLVWQMAKIAGFVFVTGILILIFIYGPVIIPSIFHRP